MDLIFEDVGRSLVLVCRLGGHQGHVLEEGIEYVGGTMNLRLDVVRYLEVNVVVVNHLHRRLTG